MQARAWGEASGLITKSWYYSLARAGLKNAGKGLGRGELVNHKELVLYYIPWCRIKKGIIVLGFCVGGAMILSSFLQRRIEVTRVSQETSFVIYLSS